MPSLEPSSTRMSSNGRSPSAATVRSQNGRTLSSSLNTGATTLSSDSSLAARLTADRLASTRVSARCVVCGGNRLVAHLAVAGEQGPEGLIPTTDRFGTALSDIVRCADCGHMQLREIPTEAELEQAYGEAASDDYVEEEAGQRATARVAARAARAARGAGAARRPRLLGRLPARRGARARLGSGHGRRAERVRLGVRARPARPRRPDRRPDDRRPARRRARGGRPRRRDRAPARPRRRARPDARTCSRPAAA